MSRHAWWLAAAAALVLLPVAALGVAAAIVDPNDYKPQIIVAVQRATGRHLTLGGPLRVSRSLWPTIAVTNVKLANLPGGTRPDMAQAERVEAQLSLFALLHRRIRLSKLTLVGPNILFELVNGQPNWVFRPEADGPVVPSRLPVRLDIRAAHVRNGMITVRLPGHQHVVGIRTLDLRHPTANDPLDLASVLVYSDYQPFIVRASARPTGGVADPWSARLAFEAYNAVVSAQGKLSLSGDYDLQIDGYVPELERLNALLPTLHLPRLHGLSISTNLTSGRAPGDLPVIGATRFQIGSGDFSDRVPGLALGAVEVSLPGAGTSGTTSGAGRYAGRAFNFGGTFGAPERLDGRARTPLDLQVGIAAMAGENPTPGAPSALTLKGELALNAGAFDGLDAVVGLRLPALTEWRPVVPATLPALTDVSLGGHLLIPANIGSVSLGRARLSARGLDVAGDVTIGLGPVSTFAGRLRAIRLDLDALRLSGPGGTRGIPGAGATAADPGQPQISNAPLPWSVLRGKTIDLTASVDALTFQQQVWREVDLALQLADGRLQISRLRLAPAGGSVAEMVLSADASKQKVPVSLTLHAPGIPLALLARYASLPGQASGLVDVEARLTGEGRSLHEIAASLSGQFAATMTSGSLSNTALIELGSASLQALGILVPTQGETTIRCLGLVGVFHAGVGRFRSIALDSTYLQLDGAGQVDLGAETVALKLYPMVRLSSSSVSVPVLVEGPFRAVRGRLDASGLDKLGLLIDAWFGGDQPQTCSEAGLSAPQVKTPD